MQENEIYISVGGSAVLNLNFNNKECWVSLLAAVNHQWSFKYNSSKIMFSLCRNIYDYRADFSLFFFFFWELEQNLKLSDF